MLFNTLVSGLILSATAVVASPVDNINAPVLVARQDFGSCRNQSCLIATVAGSTGRTVYPDPALPVGDSQDGNCCIVRYFPAVKDILYSKRPGLKEYCAANGGDAPRDSNPPGVNEISLGAAANSKRSLTELVTRQLIFPWDCKPNVLIYAKGTFEPGSLGVTVGPALASKLDYKLWNVVGVNYDNSLANTKCLGLPGSLDARKLLARYAKACPKSQLAMAGYSQGAMVVRNSLARVDSATVARVKNVVTFGDPFIGAPIGQYSGPVSVFCMTGDGVCDGRFDISAAHLSYGADINAAAAILIRSQKSA